MKHANFSICQVFLLAFIFITSSETLASDVELAQDSVFYEALIGHVVVFGYAEDDWLVDSPEYTWFYSGAVLDVNGDTMLVAASMHSAGLFDLDQSFFRVGSSPSKYSLYVSFASGILLPVQRMALDTRTKLLFLKLYVGDLLTEGYDYALLESRADVVAGSMVIVPHFRPGDGRLRRQLEVISSASGTGQEDIWDFEEESKLAEYRFDSSTNGSPVIYHDMNSDSYHLQGLLNLRSVNDRVDNIVFPIPSLEYISQLNWKRVNSARVSELRDLRSLPL